MKDERVMKGLVFAVIILFVDVTVSSNFHTNITESIKLGDLSIKKSIFGNSNVRTEVVKTHLMPIIKQAKKLTFSPIAVPVYSGYHPAVASDGFGNVVLVFEYNSSIVFASSTDGGNTWPNDQHMFFSTPAELPDVDSCGNGRFLGSYIPDQSELYMVEISGPLPDGIEVEVLPFDSVVKSVAVAGYTDEEYPEMFGSCAIVSDTGIPFYFYGAFYNEEYQIFQVDFYPTITSCEVTANDIDLVTLYAYGV